MAAVPCLLRVKEVTTASNRHFCPVSESGQDTGREGGGQGIREMHNHYSENVNKTAIWFWRRKKPQDIWKTGPDLWG